VIPSFERRHPPRICSIALADGTGLFAAGKRGDASVRLAIALMNPPSALIPS
jgi:hypothetical protein